MLDYVTIGFKGTQSYYFSLFFTGRVNSYYLSSSDCGYNSYKFKCSWTRGKTSKSSFILVFTANAFVSHQPRSIRVGWKSTGPKGVKINLVKLVKLFFIFKVDTTDLPSTDCRPLSCSFCSWSDFSVSSAHPLPSPSLWVFPWETASRIRWTGCGG